MAVESAYIRDINVSLVPPFPLLNELVGHSVLGFFHVSERDLM